MPRPAMTMRTAAPSNLAFIPSPFTIQSSYPDCHLQRSSSASRGLKTAHRHQPLRIALGAEPANRLFQRRFRGSLRNTQFAYGLATIVVHSVFGHLDAFERDARRLSRHVCHPFVYIGKGKNGPTRKAERGGCDARETAENVKYFSQHQVLASQDIPFTMTSFLHGKQVAGGDILNVHNVH